MEPGSGFRSEIMMTYKEAVIEAMGWLGEQPDTLFIGQTVGVPGSYMFGSLEKVPAEKLLELPVAEELQMGMTLGLGLEGYVPISIYPRIDFLLLALNQLVNHIDKIGVMSEDKMRPRIIIRTSIGPRKPLDGGPQHTNDYIKEIRSMCRYIRVISLDADLPPESIINQYKMSYNSPYNLPVSLLVERGDLY